MVATYCSKFYIEASILTCTVTICDSPPFTVCSRKHTPIILFRSEGRTVTFSRLVDSLTSYYIVSPFITFLMTPYWLYGAQTKTAVSVSRRVAAEVSLILFCFRLTNLIIFWVWEVLAKIYSSLIFLTSLSSLMFGSKNLKRRSSSSMDFTQVWLLLLHS